MIKPTRQDVARLAGVSVATVSNVVNKTGKVRIETVQRVEHAIKQLDYKPDLVARSLITGRTMQIGIVLEDVLNPFFGQLVKEFEDAASRKDYFVSICTGLHRLDHYFDNIVTRGLDGVFVTALPYKFETSKLYDLVDRGVKVLTSGNVNVDFHKVSSIESDYETAMYAAVQHLYNLGHRKIAYLSGLGKLQTFDLRCISYTKCIGEFGLLTKENLLVSGAPPYTTNIKDGYDCAERLLRMGADFTAAICGNDLMAMGAIRAFHEHGIQVPKDVSVMGFDGIDIGRYAEPSLSTMSVDMKSFGSKAFELLYNNICNQETCHSINQLILIEGESTGKPGSCSTNT